MMPVGSLGTYAVVGQFMEHGIKNTLKRKPTREVVERPRIATGYWSSAPAVSSVGSQQAAGADKS